LQEKLITSLDEESIERAFDGVVLEGYCIREAMEAMRAGVEVQHVYGSWKNMARAFNNHIVEIMVSDGVKAKPHLHSPHFRQDFLKLQRLVDSGLATISDWKAFVE